MAAHRESTSAAGRQQQLLEDVIQAFGDCPDERLREIMQAAVRHLHGFVADVRLTTEEWKTGIDFLTAVGQACTPTRQEFILLSDTLGLSSLTEMVSVDLAEAATENTVLGPFYVPGSPIRERGDSIIEDPDDGTPATLRGRVTDLRGNPLGGALLDVWQNASNRLYAVQDPTQTPTNLRGKFRTADDGGFAFRTIRPVPYTIPDDGPVGHMLAAARRHPWRPAHIHFLVSAPGHKTLTTHVFDGDSDYLESDAVFGVRDSLVVSFEPSGDGGEVVATFDIALEPEAGRDA